MNAATLVRAGLRHHWRTHLGVLLGCAVATATLVGALVVGDSVRYTLARRAEARIGRVDLVLSGGDRFFRDALATELAGAGARLAPVVRLPAVASSADGGRRVHEVAVHGVDERFFGLSPSGAAVALPGAGEALLSEGLARRLEAGVGDVVVLRLDRPSAIPRDMALAPEDVSTAVRVEVSGLVVAEDFGSFALDAGHAPAAAVFLSLPWLQAEVGTEGRANLILCDVDGPLPAAAAELAEALRRGATLTDLELALGAPGSDDRGSGERELSTSRIFFDAPVLAALERSPALEGAELAGVFTYFVNELRVGERATPYSMVTALGALRGRRDAAADGLGALAPTDPAGIVLNAWTADDLQAAPGDQVGLRYYVVDASGRLVERSRELRVTAVVPLAGAAADPGLMPDFPGLAEADSCREWEPGTPVDLDRIRDRDELYWDEHRGTPKAFVSLATGREMWSSRFGALTAVRFAPEHEEALRRALREDLDPAELGLYFRDVRTPAATAADSPTDFGGLFLGLSFFLVVAALLVTTQLFLFGVEERSSELGLLGAIGFPPRKISRLFFSEACVIAIAGGLLGCALGLLYTRAVLHGLATLWEDAVAGLDLAFHAEPGTVLTGLVLALACTLGVVFLAVRRRLKVSVTRLLASRHGVDAVGSGVRRGLSLTLAGVLAGAALLVVLLVDARSGTAAAGAFFGAGAAFLAAGVTLCRLLLRGARRTAAPLRSVAELGRANGRRRPGRSLATVTLMALGTFLVVAVGANRQGPVHDVGERSSGTGGFALYGRTSLPVVQDLNAAGGRDAFALSAEDLAGVAVVPLRVRPGDDASCLDLSRPRAPRLLGVDPEALAGRGAFTFAGTWPAAGDEEDGWRLLDARLADGAVPAIGDTTSLTWQLKKAVGDTVDYTDERGRPFRVRIVGAIQDTILQGDLVIASTRFEELYPTQGGYRRFLVDAPADRVDAVRTALARALEDVGLALEGSGERLDTFHSVQNTYLAIFQLLGALGLFLGSVGLGLVVLRNTLERRGELAIVSALGFTRAKIRWLLLSEYGSLHLLGLTIGGAAALLAILPALRAPGAEASLTHVLLLLLAIGANGFLWILLAARSVGARAVGAVLREE